MRAPLIFSIENQDAIIEGFAQWLALQNYTENGRKYIAGRIREFIAWCIAHKIKEEHARYFFEYQQRRQKRGGSGGLSVSYLRNYLRDLRLFRRYLLEVLSVDLPINIIYLEKSIPLPEILSYREIARLYESTTEDLLGMRDRAMLAIYYGCGLRRTEGASLIRDDIKADRNLIHVRKGKNYKERYVPMVGKVKRDILEYLTIARPGLLDGNIQAWFFIGVGGEKLSGSALYSRFKQLAHKAGLEKEVGLHSLRHSLATHLLQNGMKLSKIGKLLGHASLDTTQIYTHIVADLKDIKSEAINKNEEDEKEI